MVHHKEIYGFHFIFEIFFEIICYLISQIFLKIITLGRYPPSIEKPHSPTFIYFIGLMFFIITVMLLIEFIG